MAFASTISLMAKNSLVAKRHMIFFNLSYLVPLIIIIATVTLRSGITPQKTTQESYLFSPYTAELTKNLWNIKWNLSQIHSLPKESAEVVFEMEF